MKGQRIASVDLVRGIALLCMTLFHPIWRFMPSNEPIIALLTSGAAVSFAAGGLLALFSGLSYLALGLFCFGLGAGLGISFAKSMGDAQFFLRHIKRLALLFAIGFALDFALMYGWNYHLLTILGSIALVGLLALLFLAFPGRFRLALLIVLPFAYYALRTLIVPDQIGNDAIFHGIWGVLALGASAGFGALCGQSLASSKKPSQEILILLLVCFGIAAALAVFFPISDFDRMAVAPGYAIVSAIVGMGILILVEGGGVRVRPLELLGANALFVFVLEYFFVHYPWRIITNGETFFGDPFIVLAFVLMVNLAYYVIVKFVSQRGIRLGV